MAKKKGRKPNISSQALERARAELSHEGNVATATEDTTPDVVRESKPRQQVVRSFKRTMTREELSQEYGYVIQDLRSMAILALILFVGMIAVSITFI
jgi:hypothetical protein